MRSGRCTLSRTVTIKSHSFSSASNFFSSSDFFSSASNLSLCFLASSTPSWVCIIPFKIEKEQALFFAGGTLLPREIRYVYRPKVDLHAFYVNLYFRGSRKGKILLAIKIVRQIVWGQSWPKQSGKILVVFSFVLPVTKLKTFRSKTWYIIFAKTQWFKALKMLKKN